MKIKYFLLVLIISVSLMGCSSEHSVVLYNNDETIYESYNEVPNNSYIELPVLEEEEKIFVGWSDGDLIYNNELRIRRDLELTAVFEDASEVFEYDYDTEINWVYITGYTGDAKYLRIPVKIEDMFVKYIEFNAFKNSQLIEVEIPKTVSKIYNEAFDGSSDLEKISFYGEYFGEDKRIIYHEEYDGLLEEFGEACTVIEETENSWRFSEGCPIKSVDDYEVIEGYEYEVTRYEVTVDLRWYESEITGSGLHIYSKAFSNLESLTTVEFPSRYKAFYPKIFYNTPRLTNVSFKDSDYFETIDNIVYNIGDVNELSYYPAGLEYENFEIPSFVNIISPLAFHDNFYLKTITIPENITEISLGGIAFYTAHSLEAINVEPNNSLLYSIDGVLYGQNHTLIAYPVAKDDTEFIMPDTTHTVAPYAFSGQKYLESITFSPNLEFLGGMSFMGVEKLKVLEIPASVIYIGDDFTRDSSIERIFINRSYVEDGPFNNFVLSHYSDFPVIYVPDDSIGQYRLYSNWQFVRAYIYPVSEFDTEE